MITNGDGDKGVDTDPVKVAPVSAPTKVVEPPPTEAFKLPERPRTVYKIDNLPTFNVGEFNYSLNIPEPKPLPAPPAPAPAPPAAEPANSDGEIWGSYLAKWKKPEATVYKKPVEPWKPAAYQPFDFSKYLLKSRETKPAAPHGGYVSTAPQKRYWWDKGGATQQARKPWWNAPAGDVAEDKGAAPAQHWKPARKPYIPGGHARPAPVRSPTAKRYNWQQW